VFLLSCEGVKILTVTNVNNRRRLFLINVFVLTICKFTNRQNETNNSKGEQKHKKVVPESMGGA
jgi:hypothetical protein